MCLAFGFVIGWYVRWGVSTDDIEIDWQEGVPQSSPDLSDSVIVGGELMDMIHRMRELSEIIGKQVEISRDATLVCTDGRRYRVVVSTMNHQEAEGEDM